VRGEKKKKGSSVLKKNENTGAECRHLKTMEKTDLGELEKKERKRGIEKRKKKRGERCGGTMVLVPAECRRENTRSEADQIQVTFRIGTWTIGKRKGDNASGRA